MIKAKVIKYVSEQYTEYGAFIKRDLLQYVISLRDTGLLTITEYIEVSDLIIEIARDLCRLYY